MTDHPLMNHNGGPPLEEAKRPRKLSVRTQWAKALFADEKTPAPVIAMCWAIHWYSQDDGGGAALSNEQFTAMCGVPDRSVTRGKAWLLENGYVSIRVGRSGQKTRFQMLIPSKPETVEIESGKASESVDPVRHGGVLQPATVADSQEPARHGGGIEDARVAALANSIRQGGGLEDEQDAQVAGSPQSIRQGGEVNPPGWRPAIRQGGALIQEGTQERKQEEKNGAAAPRMIEVPEKQKPNFWKNAFGVHDDVIFDDGKLTLVNGAREEWLGQFQGDEQTLNLALIEIAADIQPNSQVPVKSQVAKRLARMVRTRNESTARYDRAVARNRGGGSTDKPQESQRERAKRFAEEAASQIDAEKARRR